eukprot:1158006-Pelagomonas_calceolata.AAC.18
MICSQESRRAQDECELLRTQLEEQRQNAFQQQQDQSVPPPSLPQQQQQPNETSQASPAQPASKIQSPPASSGACRTACVHNAVSCHTCHVFEHEHAMHASGLGCVYDVCHMQDVNCTDAEVRASRNLLCSRCMPFMSANDVLGVG